MKKIIYVIAASETPNTISCTNNYSTKVKSHWLQQSLFILIFDVVDHLRSLCHNEMIIIIMIIMILIRMK
jgi:hypothetical protein